jgi:arylsulfatase A-like enzyme
MQRRDFCRLLGAAPLAARAATSPPNIVYVLADDLGWGDLGCYNRASAVPTPNADHLASQGVRFTDMHSPSSVCTPTRYGILTGRYCWRSPLKKGVLWGYSPSLIEPGRMTVASMLKARGYSTAGIGKWHLGLGSRDRTDYAQPLRPGPLDHGFDYYYGIPASLDMDPYLYFENDRAVEQPTAQTPGSKDPRGVFWRAGAMAPGFRFEDVLPTLVDKATAYLRRPHRQPYFLYLALPAPHTPWLPTKAFEKRSQAGIYGDFVAMVDAMLGRVLEAVDPRNTLVIFTSDNGAHWNDVDKALFAHRANANWRGEKADIWDAGHRIPFIARWPGRIKAGGASSELGCLTDLMATAAAITGATLPSDSGEDSFNLLPALLGQPHNPIREAVVHHSSEGMFAIRRGKWKLELGLGSGGFTPPVHLDPKPGEAPGQLYDIEADPAENTNLFAKRPEIVAELTALLERYQRQGHSRPIA